MTVSVSQINIYPLKSAAQISLDHSLITNDGLEHDRRLMLVDEAGICITAREFPELLRVHTQVSTNEYQFTYKTDSISASTTTARNQNIKVNVHGSICMAAQVSPEADEWFSNALGINCRLVKMIDDDVREVDFGSDTNDSELASFADEYALLLISEASLTDLNQRLNEPVGMRNFRPNLVVSGTGAFAEDGWNHIRIGENEFKVTEKCQRCKLTTIDPDTAVAREDREPLKTLLKFRRDESENGVIFGVYLAPTGDMGSVHLNDEVTVLS